jgi:hypothetical protein
LGGHGGVRLTIANIAKIANIEKFSTSGDLLRTSKNLAFVNVGNVGNLGNVGNAF